MISLRTAFICALLLTPFLLASCFSGASPATLTPTEQAKPATATGTTPSVLPTATRTKPAATPVASPTLPPFVPPDLRYLEAAFQDALAPLTAEQGTLASYYVESLEDGQAIASHEAVAISGMSLVKIPILVEVYRRLDATPTPTETTLITETATLSGNYTANLLLELIAGGNGPFAGAAELTASMRRFGFYDTFIAVPYDREPRPGYLPTYATLANQREITTNPDTSMQTTTRDLGRLLSGIYHCAQGEESLLQRAQDGLTAPECQAIMEVMAQNKIEAFIEAGVPAGITVAHKHGWVGDTHGDAAIVLAPEYPYVLVVALHRPGWLEWAESTALIAELSRLAYRHFADPGAYPVTRLETLLPPRPSPTITPALPQAVVAGTQGAGLTLRKDPAGPELLILPEGMRLYLLPAEPVTTGGVTWRKILAPGGASGWVGEQFLENGPTGD